MIEKVFTKNFIVHSISYLLLTTAFYFLLPTLPLYVVRVLKEDKSMVGYITGFYALSALLIRPFAGYALDTWGRKPIYLTSLAFYTVLIFTYNFAATFFLLIIIRLLHGLSWGMLTTGGSTIVADIVPANKRGQGIGYFGLATTLSMAIGPLLGLWILGQVHYDRLFLTSALVAGVALLMACFIVYPKVEMVRHKLAWNSIIEKSVLPIAFVMLIVAIPYAGMMTFIPLLSDELGIENGGLFFLVYAIGVSILRPAAGKIMDKRGPAMIMLTSFTLSISGLFLIYFSKEINFFLGGAFVLGLGNGILMPTLQTMIINMVKAERRGVANSTFFSSIDLGIGIGSVILGYLAEFTSLSFLFLFSGVILLFPMFYFFIFVVGKYNRSINQPES
ncbi:MAG: MFS transporter [Bacteroidota bacterium]|nr:MFS transporter [Bacteroidota bacterium]